MMDWNATISNDGNGEFVVLPEGEYEFLVTKFEKSVFDGSNRIPKCNMAELELAVRAESGTSLIRERLFLDESMEWKLCQFFSCIGQRAHGDKYVMDWSKVLGAKGRAHIVINEYVGQDGATRQNNKVKKYLPAAKPVAQDDPANLPFEF